MTRRRKKTRKYLIWLRQSSAKTRRKTFSLEKERSSQEAAIRMSNARRLLHGTWWEIKVGKSRRASLKGDEKRRWRYPAQFLRIIKRLRLKLLKSCCAIGSGQAWLRFSFANRTLSKQLSNVTRHLNCKSFKLVLWRSGESEVMSPPTQCQPEPDANFSPIVRSHAPNSIEN